MTQYFDLQAIRTEAPVTTSLGPSASGRPATRADVARHAGVSTAVVSYVVNDGPRAVAPRTAARVRAAVEALQYSPNVNARALKRGSTELIGLVVPDIGNPFFAELARAIEAAAAARGLLVALGNSNASDVTERKLVNDLAGRHVDGLVLATVLTPAVLAALPRPHRPTVMISALPVPGYTTIGPNARGGAHDLVSHLLDVHEHTDVALVMGESHGRLPEPREEGWAEALAAHDLQPGPVVRASFSRAGGYEAMRRMLRWSKHPAAVFLSSDQQAVGAYRALREAGLDCPDDVVLVCYDGTSEAEFAWPTMTVSRQAVSDMAHAAVTALLTGPDSEQFQQFDNELIVRRSCGCQRETSTVTS